METLKFQTNHNNALNLGCFPAIRKESHKYKIGAAFEIVLGTKPLGVAELLQIQVITYAQITRSMALLTTGKEPAYLQAILKRMYPEDWNTCKFYYMIFHYTAQVQQQTELQKVEAPKTYAYQGTLDITARPQKTHS